MSKLTPRGSVKCVYDATNSDVEFLSATGHIPPCYRDSRYKIGVLPCFNLPHSSAQVFPYLVKKSNSLLAVNFIVYAESRDHVVSYLGSGYAIIDEPVLFDYQYEEGVLNGLHYRERLRVVQEFVQKHS